MSIYNSLKYYRKKNNLTQKEVADYLGVRMETVHRIEKGKCLPTLVLAYKFSKVFNKKIEQLFDFSKEEI